MILADTILLSLQVDAFAQQAEIDSLFDQIDRSYHLHKLTRPRELYQLLTYEQDEEKLRERMDGLCQKSENLLVAAQHALSAWPEESLDDIAFKEFEVKELEQPIPDSPMLFDPFFGFANLAQDTAEHMSTQELHKMYLITTYNILNYQYLDNVNFEHRIEKILEEHREEDTANVGKEGLDESTLIESSPPVTSSGAVDFDDPFVEFLPKETPEPEQLIENWEVSEDSTYSAWSKVPQITVPRKSVLVDSDGAFQDQEAVQFLDHGFEGGNVKQDSFGESLW
jgi:hypothetical protein